MTEILKTPDLVLDTIDLDPLRPRPDTTQITFNCEINNETDENITNSLNALKMHIDKQSLDQTLTTVEQVKQSDPELYVFTLSDLETNCTPESMQDSVDSPFIVPNKNSDSDYQTAADQTTTDQKSEDPMLLIKPDEPLCSNETDAMNQISNDTNVPTCPNTCPGPDEQVVIKPSEVEPRYVIHRLAMVCSKLCMICEKRQSKSCKQFAVSLRWGWMYCENCFTSGMMRKVILGWMNTDRTIPCTWLVRSETFSQSVNARDAIASCRYLNFFRYSKRHTQTPVYEGRVYPYDDEGVRIRFVKATQDGARPDGFGTMLAFYDAETNSHMERFVSLENIFAHNPQFYQELIACEDLLHVSEPMFKISYNDLEQTFRDEIEHAYGLSLVTDPCGHKF